VGGVVPHPRLVPVAVEDDRSLGEPCLQAVRVELGLLLPDSGVPAGPLRLDQPEWLAVVVPQDVVDEAAAGFSLGGRHPGHLELAVIGVLERPAGLLEQPVDDQAASGRLVVVVGVGADLVGDLGRRDRGPEFGEFSLQAGVLVARAGDGGVLLGEPGVLGLERRLSLHPDGRGHGPGNGFGVEGDVGRGQVRRVARVVARQPVEDLEQLPEHR